jgi:hypothetical protein
MEYESVTQKVLFGNAVLAALLSERKYDVTLQSVIKTQCRYRTQYGKDLPPNNAIRRWLKQFQKTGNVPHRKGAGRASTAHEHVHRIRKAWTS